MASLFQGTPQTATSYTTSSSETPKWMQDAIYNQIQWATQTANAPFQPYSGQLVAGLTPQQQQAYQQVSSNQGAWQPAMSTAQAGTQNLADTSSVSNIQNYMNPYQQGVLDVIAKQGARNLTENLLPGVSDTFIRAGQFGSGRMGEFGSRALRDTQEAIVNAQTQAAQQGYTQALGASQADLTRQQSALQQMANMAQTGQQLRTADVAALEAAGQAQQAQQQKELESQYQQYQLAQQYPKTQLDWLNAQVRGMAPSVPATTSTSGTTTGQTYSASPLAQMASAYNVYKGITS